MFTLAEVAYSGTECSPTRLEVLVAESPAVDPVSKSFVLMRGPADQTLVIPGVIKGCMHARAVDLAGNSSDISPCVRLETTEEMDTSRPLPVAGGPCDYVNIPGMAVVDEVKTAADWHNNCSNAVEVIFHFVPDDPAARTRYLRPDWSDTEKHYVVGDGKNPPRNWAREVGLVVGSEHRVIRSEITRGTCTPVIFIFPDIDSTTSEDECFARAE